MLLIVESTLLPQITADIVIARHKQYNATQCRQSGKTPVREFARMAGLFDGAYFHSFFRHRKHQSFRFASYRDQCKVNEFIILALIAKLQFFGEKNTN